MNRLLLIILVVVFSNTTRAQQCLEISKEFEAGDTAYLFGDNVKLRSKPSTDSETLQLLKIGDRVVIIEKTNETMPFQGMDSPWYKVNHKGTHGFVLGSLISRITRENNATRCFISLERDDSQLYILTRVISSSNSAYIENKSAYLGDDNEFCVNLSDGKGVEGIRAIVQISYSPSSCSANSGGYHLFFDNENLYKVMDLTSRGEYGYATSETLHFPTDDLGEEHKIIYIKEEMSQSDTYDEEENGYIYEKSSKYVVKLEWVDHKLKPEPSVFQENP